MNLYLDEGMWRTISREMRPLRPFEQNLKTDRKNRIFDHVLPEKSF